MKVTKAGQLLYPYAKVIVNDFTRSKDAIQQEIGKSNANLQVGATFTIGEYLLPSLLGRFKKQHPDVRVSLIIKNTPSILEDLTHDVIDLALVEGMFDHKDLIVEKFADDELVLVCAPEHHWEGMIDIEELANERMIWRESLSFQEHA